MKFQMTSADRAAIAAAVERDAAYPVPECAGGCGGVATLGDYCESGCAED